MAHPEDRPAPDPRLGRARLAVLLSMAAALGTTAAVAGVGIVLDPRPGRQVAGTLGILAVAATQAVALHAAATGRRTRWAGLAAAAATLASISLVAPLGVAQGWETWAWLAAGAAGAAPIIAGRRVGLGIAAATVGLAAAVGAWVGASALEYAVLTAVTGAGIAALHGLPLALWRLVLEARDGRDAVARLATADERLRFARDVHDLLGHHLTVIALKAELAGRLAAHDPAAAAEHAEQARALAAAALTEMRQIVHGYRAVDLDAHVAAVAAVLRSSGVRCTVTPVVDIGRLPAAAATALAAVAREAGTNVLRHSRAQWCTIELVQSPTQASLVIANDGVPATRTVDARSSGLWGLSERLAEHGGSLATAEAAGVFTLTATLPTATLPTATLPTR